MSVAAWEDSAYVEETENTELALVGFGADASRRAVEAWISKIASGEYQVMPFEAS